MGSARKCFVCGKPVDIELYEINKEVNMPVCSNCKGTDTEKRMVDELLDSLADGFVCGCI